MIEQTVEGLLEKPVVLDSEGIDRYPTGSSHPQSLTQIRPDRCHLHRARQKNRPSRGRQTRALLTCVTERHQGYFVTDSGQTLQMVNLHRLTAAV